MEEVKPNALPIPPSKIFQAFERFYVRLLSVLRALAFALAHE
jgi:hypothetical protein